MKILPNPFIGLCFLQRHNTLFDTRWRNINFPYLSMQLPWEPTFYTIQPVETFALSRKKPQSDRDCHTVFTHGGTWEYHHRFSVEYGQKQRSVVPSCQFLGYALNPSHQYPHGRLRSRNSIANQIHQIKRPINPHLQNAPTHGKHRCLTQPANQSKSIICLTKKY